MDIPFYSYIMCCVISAVIIKLGGVNGFNKSGWIAILFFIILLVCESNSYSVEELP